MQLPLRFKGLRQKFYTLMSIKADISPLPLNSENNLASQKRIASMSVQLM
jgi:hypothetical protein